MTCLVILRGSKQRKKKRDGVKMVGQAAISTFGAPVVAVSGGVSFLVVGAPPTIFFSATISGTEDNLTGSSISIPFGSRSPAIVCAAAKVGASNNIPITGVVFEPFEEVKKELNLVPNVPQQSLGHQKHADDSEFVINEQINNGAGIIIGEIDK